MGRVREAGRDVAFYFGIGEGSDATRASTPEQESFGDVVIRVAPPLVAAMLLGLALGVDDDLVGYATLLGLVLVLALAWAAVLGAFHSSSRDR